MLSQISFENDYREDFQVGAIRFILDTLNLGKELKHVLHIDERLIDLRIEHPQATKGTKKLYQIPTEATDFLNVLLLFCSSSCLNI